MFNGFELQNTPSYKLWDFTKTSGTSYISLEDNCAPIQIIAAGNGVIYLTLPINPVPGKTILIKNEYAGNDGNRVFVYIIDPTANSNSPNPITFGSGQTIILCYVPQATILRSTGQVVSSWVTLNQASWYSKSAYSSVLSGNSNYSGAAYLAQVLAGGSGNATNASYASVLGGQFNGAIGQWTSVSGGYSNTASDNYAFVGGGYNNFSNGFASFIGAGYYGSARAIKGIHVFPAHNSPIQEKRGATQETLLQVGVQTTDATATVLRSDTSGATTNNQLILPNNSAYYVKGKIISNVTGAGNTSSWEFTACIKRGANAASTALVGVPTVTMMYQDAGASGWVVAVSADTTNGGLAVTVTGQASTTIRWVCTLQSTEVTF